MFTSICTVGNGLKSIAHSLQEEVTVTLITKSAFSNAMESYHQVNTLYNRTINCFSTVAQSSIASNKTFTYKEAMRESDYHEFVKAMVKEVDDHESRNHWTVMQRCNMPSDTKTIMSIWSFKPSATQMVSTNTRHAYVRMAECKLGGRIIGKLMHLS
jgi:hypothetical protein